MPTEQVRLSNEAIDALKSYAPNHPLSTAILLMHKEVTNSNKWVIPDSDYWSHFEALLKKYSKQVVTTPQEPPIKPFQTGTAIKQIGKIDPDEVLQEPVGRQGRSV